MYKNNEQNKKKTSGVNVIQNVDDDGVVTGVGVVLAWCKLPGGNILKFKVWKHQKSETKKSKRGKTYVSMLCRLNYAAVGTEKLTNAMYFPDKQYIVIPETGHVINMSYEFVSYLSRNFNGQKSQPKNNRPKLNW